jgi:hypothetical protein
MTTVDPNTVSLFRDSARIPDPYWQELLGLAPEEVCHKALVSFKTDEGYRIPFLDRMYICQPEARHIYPLNDQQKALSFQHYLVLLVYLIKARDIPLKGKKINEREIPGGELFFRGPHALLKDPLEKKFAQDPQGFLDTGLALGGRETGKGEASFELLVLPRIPVEYIFYGADEEFPAQVLIHFDSTVYLHLPLDVLWAMINIVGHRLLPKEKE